MHEVREGVALDRTQNVSNACADSVSVQSNLKVIKFYLHDVSDL